MAEEVYLSVIIPAYNEEKNISFTVKEIIDYLKEKKFSWEIIVVDDGSKDRTFDITNVLRGQNPRLIVLKNTENRGKGYTVKRGMLTAKGQYRLFMDADNSTKIFEIDNFLKAIEQGADIAIGSRHIIGAKLDVPQPLCRRFLGWIYRVLCRMLLQVSVSDFNCGFKLFSKDAAEHIFNKIFMDRWSFDTEIIFLAKKLGYRIKEVPVSWQYTGTSAVRPLRDGIRSYLDLLRIRRNDKTGIYK